MAIVAAVNAIYNKFSIQTKMLEIERWKGERSTKSEGLGRHFQNATDKYTFSVNKFMHNTMHRGEDCGRLNAWCCVLWNLSYETMCFIPSHNQCLKFCVFTKTKNKKTESFYIQQNGITTNTFTILESNQKKKHMSFMLQTIYKNMYIRITCCIE